MRKNIQKYKTTILLGLILLLAAFLRLYRISDYMTFLGDEGRDVLVVKHILEGQFTLLGPRASAGDFFTGPIYYYFMAPFLWLFHLDPVGPAVMIALLGITTVWLIYYIGKRFFNETAGLIAALLYTISPLVLTYSRSSWNPNPMPFFTLLLLYLLYLTILKNSWKKFLLVGILYGIALQLHYIETFVAPIIFFFVLIANFVHHPDPELVEGEGSQIARKGMLRLRLSMTNVTMLCKNYLLIFLGFLVGFLPFLLFEFRHDFANTRTILHFVTYGNMHDPNSISSGFFQIIGDVYFRLFGHLIAGYPVDQFARFNPFVLSFWQIMIWTLSLTSIVLLYWLKNKLAALLLFLWFFFGVLLFGFYHKPIYDYYFEFMFPLPFLLIGNLFSFIFQGKKLQPIGNIICLITLGVLLWLNISQNELWYTPNKQKDQVEKISEFVLSKTNNKPFNFALITPGNSDYAYLYYFEIYHHSPVTIQNLMIDPKRTTVTDQLLIVCEDLGCKPLGNPLWEIAGFGRAEIEGEWSISVVRVYRLIHYAGK